MALEAFTLITLFGWLSPSSLEQLWEENDDLTCLRVIIYITNGS